MNPDYYRILKNKENLYLIQLIGTINIDLFR